MSVAAILIFLPDSLVSVKHGLGNSL